jgi:hypothetical protein
MAHRLIPLTPPLFFHFTLPLKTIAGPWRNEKKVINLRECTVMKGPSIDTTHTPPLFSFYTTFKQF